MKKIKIALMTFSDPRYTENPDNRERYIEDSHKTLKKILLSQNLEIVDPHDEVKRKNSYNFGFDGTEEVKKAANYINSKGADVLILECYHWSEPQFANLAVKYINIPTIVYSIYEPKWAGCVYFGAVCASLLEVPVNNYARLHTRVFNDNNLLFKSINAYSIYSVLRESALILFGGSYSLNMPLLRDDYEFMKSFMIEEIYEDEHYLIIQKAKEIMKNAPGRISGFYNWLEKNNAKIQFDNKMVNKKILETQIAFYLATKDIINDYYPNNVIGISLKCQPVLSEYFGVTGCSIPTFIPFGIDSEGEKQIISVTCEGDVKGLFTCCILSLLTGGKIPSLFGDLKLIEKDYIILSNCGGSSLYYASNSNDPKFALENLKIMPQCQGKSGAAFGYNGKKFSNCNATVARLVRENRDYVMHLFKGETLDITDSMINKIGFGNTWPHIGVKTGKDMQEFALKIASNHYCLIPGDFIFEVKKLCELFGIKVLEL